MKYDRQILQSSNDTVPRELPGGIGTIERRRRQVQRTRPLRHFAVKNQSTRQGYPFSIFKSEIYSSVPETLAWGVGVGAFRQPMPDASLVLEKDTLWHGYYTRAVLIVDLVDSVRLIQENEVGSVTRWIEFVNFIEQNTLPRFAGRLKKRLGDGLLIDFDDPRNACGAALDIRIACANGNTGRPESEHFLLRMGIDVADVLEDPFDLYGHGVNRAARLMAIAGPGDIFISSEARHQTVADLDADFEDLGDCYLKNIKEPVRAYRVRIPGEASDSTFVTAQTSLNPTLAILPFTPRVPSKDAITIGDIMSDELTQVFSVSANINVISHLSAAAFRGRAVDLAEVKKHFAAEYILSGRFVIEANHIDLFVELADTSTGNVVWADLIRKRLGSLYRFDPEFISSIVANTSKAINDAELRRARQFPLPNLQTHSLLMAAVALMHRMSLQDFHRSFEMLQEVLHRAGRQAVPHAWMAKWYVLRAQQGWSEDAKRDARLAQASARRALDADPESSLALTVDGLVHTHMLKDHETARDLYRRAVESNPNNSLAWLLKGSDYAFTGDGSAAVADTQKAIRLSPLDPHRYYYDTLAATAYLADRQYEQALKFADRSLRANKMHTSSLRAKSVACWQLGRRDEARKVGKVLMDLEPNLSIKTWRARTPSSGHPISDEWADILKKVGVPD